MKKRILILGAGFAGLELATALSEALGSEIEVTVIDQSDHFIFGYSKLDVMFGVDVDFFSGPKPTGSYYEPSEKLREDKVQFGAVRRARWFGRS